jgi:hypothetical protein
VDDPEPADQPIGAPTDPLRPTGRLKALSPPRALTGAERSGRAQRRSRRLGFAIAFLVLAVVAALFIAWYLAVFT